MLRLLLVFALATTSLAAPSGENEDLLSTSVKFVKDCGDKSVFLCLKERALRFLDQQDGDVKITDGIALVKTEQVATGRSFTENELPAEPEQREAEIDSLIVDRVARFLSSHTLQFRIPKESIRDMQRSLEEARGKKKKAKKVLLPLLLLLKLKAAALLPLALGALALIAFKALIIGKLALLISGIIGLKKLLESKGGSQSYEIVAHPQHSYTSSYDEHTAHAGGHYRSFDSQNLAYSGYKQE